MSIPSSFGVSTTSGVLSSWLSTATASSNAASILGASSGSTASPLSALLNKSASTAPSTAEALAGLIKPSQQRVIAALGDNGGPLGIPWNANGTEPTTVAALRTAGWIKLDSKTQVDGSKGGTYELTKLGAAIYARVGGGAVDGETGALTSADTNGTTSTASTSALQSSVSDLTSILGSVGVTV
jgi:hypothetical protein